MWNHGEKRETCCLARICTERVRFTSIKEDPRAISITNSWPSEVTGGLKSSQISRKRTKSNFPVVGINWQELFDRTQTIRSSKWCDDSVAFQHYAESTEIRVFAKTQEREASYDKGKEEKCRRMQRIISFSQYEIYEVETEYHRAFYEEFS